MDMYDDDEESTIWGSRVALLAIWGFATLLSVGVSAGSLALGQHMGWL